ncbi:MAG: DUF4270 domain-containing protein [Bacteroides sp.]|nr:DUF4270 domain-containing protein [Bacteroides sp.]
MKIKYVWIWIALLALAGCDDSTGTLGLDVLPDTDAKEVKSTTYYVETRSMEAGAVYAKTSTGYLGRFTDDEFGYLEASFLTEFFCQTSQFVPEVYDPQKLTTSVSMAGDTIKHVNLRLYYQSYFGDPLVASYLNVYELDKKLIRHPYIDIDPEQYYNPNDPNSLLGGRAYTADDPSGNDIDTESGLHMIKIPLKNEFGERILKHYREQPEDFADPNKFIDNVLQGVYVKNEYGDGSILYVEAMELELGFNVHYKDSLGNKYIQQDGNDSIFSASTLIAATKEVIQANRITQSEEKIEEKVKEPQWTYLKTPAGIFTEVTLPLDTISKYHQNDTISGVRLVFTHYYEKSDEKYSMSPPDSLLLVRKHDDEYRKFFEENKIYDNVTSYFTVRNSSTNQYTYSNISRLITICIAEKQREKEKAQKEAGSSWDEKAWEEKWKTENPDWDKMVLIPIKQVNASATSTDPVGVYHDLRPSYVKLKGGDPDKDGDLLDMLIGYIDFTTKR